MKTKLVKGLGSKVLSGIKSALGIKSPSKVFNDMVDMSEVKDAFLKSLEEVNEDEN